MAEEDRHAGRVREFGVRAEFLALIPGEAATQTGRQVGEHVGQRVTVEDITYISTWEGWLYLATVIDYHAEAVGGWSMATRMRTDLICDAITMAAANSDLASGAIFHSDR